MWHKMSQITGIDSGARRPRKSAMIYSANRETISNASTITHQRIGYSAGRSGSKPNIHAIFVWNGRFVVSVWAANADTSRTIER